MPLKILICLAILPLFFACRSDNQTEAIQQKSAEQLYQTATLAATKMELDSAFLLLRKAFEQGFEQPMQIIRDPDFYVLVDSAKYRPQFRSLLQEFSRSNHAEMVRQEETGDSLFVSGMIIDESTRQPLSGVSIELVHTDDQGLYFSEKSNWNPRIFAYLITDEKGAFSIRTIRPGKYQDEDGNYIPAHIHFSLKKENYREYNSEFTFADDPLFDPDANLENLPVAELIEGGRHNEYQVTIALQPD